MSLRALPLAVLCVGAVAGIVRAQAPPRVAVVEDRAPSHAIFPTQALPLRFSHARHMRLGAMTCERCHADAVTSDRAEDRLVPAESTCTPCHAIDRTAPQREATPVARCDGCHVGWDPRAPARVARVVIPPANLRFSHRVHVVRGQSCASCHGDTRAIGLATRLELPRMSLCVSCHRPAGAPHACRVCHLTEPDGTLRTRFAEGWLNPPEWMRGLHHDADFWVTHRLSAAQDATRCAVCHRDDDCAACHDGRLRDRRTHPNDYVTLHVADARMNADRCGSCHRVASFCVTCHQRAGVAETSGSASRVLGRFHPPAAVWVSAPVTTRHHGVEARRSLQACVSCHAEQDCVACHAPLGRGAGFSPHPPGFVQRCGALLRASERPCAVCHEDRAALAARCR